MNFQAFEQKHFSCSVLWNKPHQGPSSPPHPPRLLLLQTAGPAPHRTQQPGGGGATVCICVRVSVSVYACVFVCLRGMAGQRNALAHAWLSRHNGPALSHCGEIPPWYGWREKRKRKEGEAEAEAEAFAIDWNTSVFFSKLWHRFILVWIFFQELWRNSAFKYRLF